MILLSEEDAALFYPNSPAMQPPADPAGNIQLSGAASAPEPVPKTDGETSAERDQRIAEALYGPAPEAVEQVEIGDEIKALRAEPERRFCDAELTFRGVLDDEQFPEVEDEQARRVVAAEVREMAVDLGLSPSDVRDWSQRAARLQAEPVDPVEQQEAAVQLLNERFGTDARQALRDARLLIERDPRTGQVIDALGLGNDGPTILRLAEEARRQLAAGKLRRRASG